MSIELSRSFINSGIKPRQLQGTDLGYLVVERKVCWNCYGEGKDYDSPNKECRPCKGLGFIEHYHSLEMALAGMNITGGERSSTQWVSYPRSGVNNSGNRYSGVRIFASAPPDITPTDKAYALLVDMRGLNNGPSVANNLFATADGVMEDFFLRYATTMEEVAWFYRNSDGGLDILKFDEKIREVTFIPLLEHWDGTDFRILNVYFDGALQFMVESTARLADEKPY